MRLQAHLHLPKIPPSLTAGTDGVPKARLHKTAPRTAAPAPIAATGSAIMGRLRSLAPMIARSQYQLPLLLIAATQFVMAQKRPIAAPGTVDIHLTAVTLSVTAQRLSIIAPRTAGSLPTAATQFVMARRLNITAPLIADCPLTAETASAMVMKPLIHARLTAATPAARTPRVYWARPHAVASRCLCA
jgi:hypothetical protein